MKMTTEQLLELSDTLLETLNELEPADIGLLLSYVAGRMFGSKKMIASSKSGLEGMLTLFDSCLRRYAALQQLSEEDDDDTKTNSTH
jgi:hypothetical protein